MGYDTISAERTDHGLTVILDRPDKKNALTGKLFQELQDAVENAIEAEADVITIRGAGGDFSAGVDMSNVPEWIDSKPLQVRDQIREIQAVLEYLESVEVPIIAALQGYVLGGALELAISCDLRVATTDATFGLPESKLGLAMNYGGAQKLPGFIGEGLTKYLIMTGENIDAHRAHDAGLVEKLVEPRAFEDEVADLESTLADRPTYVHGFAKQQIHSARPAALEESMGQAIHHAIAAYHEEETQQRSLEFLEE